MDEKLGGKSSTFRVRYACGSDVVMDGAARAHGGTPSVPESFKSQHSQKTSNSQLSFLF